MRDQRKRNTISVRFDPDEERLLRHMARRRRTSISEVIREAVTDLAEKEQKKPVRPYDQIADLIGSLEGLSPDLSQRTGERFHQMLLEDAKRRK